MEKIEKRRAFIINCIYVFLIGAMIYLSFRYVLPVIAPLLIAWIIAAILNRPIRYITKKTKLKRSIISVLVLLLFYLTVGSIIVLLGIKIFTAIQGLFTVIPGIYKNEIEPYFIALLSNLNEDLSLMDPTFITSLNDITSSLLQSLASAVSSFSMWVVTLVSNYATSVPKTFVRIVFTIIASVFMASEYELIGAFFKRQMSDHVRVVVNDIHNYLKHILVSYVKSYSLIMFITFCELSIGFLIIGIDNPILIALLIAIFDILPVVGTGTIMVPWVIINLIRQDVWFALALAIIYVTITIIRNIIEPKIVGSQMGIHPLVSLTCIFLGADLFGIIGLVGLPILASLLNYLNSKGTIRLFR